MTGAPDADRAARRRADAVGPRGRARRPTTTRGGCGPGSRDARCRPARSSVDAPVVGGEHHLLAATVAVEVGEDRARGADALHATRRARDEVRVVVHEDLLLRLADEPVAGAAVAR